MNKILTALFGMAGLSILAPAMAHADSLSISFSTGYPVYAAPVTTYHYADYRPQPNVIVIQDREPRDYHDRGRHLGHERDRRNHYEHHERCGHAEHERREYRHTEYRGTGHGYSGYSYQPAPVIKRIETNPRLYR